MRGAAGDRLWPALGVLVTALLALVDLSAGRLLPGEPSSVTNISGTFALAPALTGAGGSRRQTVAVGALAVAVAVLLVVLDGVPPVPATSRVLVVGVGAVLATWAAGLRRRHLAQLRNRREVARTLQEALLAPLPSPAGLELAGRYLPADSGERVGGDWYDGIVGTGGATTVVIGDVAGHDVHAAAAMGQVRAVLRAYAVDRDEPPSQLLRRLERALHVLGLDVLATAVVVRIEPDEGAGGVLRIQWSNAGHPPPLLLHGDGRVEVLAGAPELLLGMDPDAERHDSRVHVPAGSTLLLHTDGLVERRGSTLDAGLERLVSHLAGRAGQELDELLDGLLAGLPPAEDDVAVLAVRVRPAAPAH